jgi:hypothetical protein
VSLLRLCVIFLFRFGLCYPVKHMCRMVICVFLYHHVFTKLFCFDFSIFELHRIALHRWRFWLRLCVKEWEYEDVDISNEMVGKDECVGQDILVSLV